MALRIFLVAIVAALGLELPGSDELAGWERSGREWVAARMADLSSLCLDEAPTNEPTEAAPDRVDLAFEAVAESMASAFSSDLALNVPRAPVEEAVASIKPQADLAPAVAAVPVVVEPQAPQESTLERISTAVRLTKQAVDAWASLVQPTTERIVIEDPVDSF
jgi:hypothetical protein